MRLFAPILLALWSESEYLAPTAPCPETKYDVEAYFRWLRVDKKLCMYFAYDESAQVDSGFSCGLASCLAYCLNDP